MGLFGQRGEMEVRRVPEDEETPEFFVPAMFQFSGDKGRIERFLDAVLEQRGEADVGRVPEEFAGDFYLPAADPDEYGREVEEPPADLAPASEVEGTDDDEEI